MEVCSRQNSRVHVEPGTSGSTEGVSGKFNAKHAYLGERPALERDRKPNPYNDGSAAHKQTLV